MCVSHSLEATYEALSRNTYIRASRRLALRSCFRGKHIVIYTVAVLSARVIIALCIMSAVLWRIFQKPLEGGSIASYTMSTLWPFKFEEIHYKPFLYLTMRVRLNGRRSAKRT